MASKAKKPAPSPQKKSMVKPVKSGKTITARSPSKPVKSNKPAAQAPKTIPPARQSKTAKPGSRVQLSNSQKSPKGGKPVNPAKTAALAKSAKTHPTVKPTKPAKKTPAPEPKKTVAKPPAIKSSPKTAVKSTKPVSEPKSAAKKPAPPSFKPTTQAPTLKKNVQPEVKSAVAKAVVTDKVSTSKSQARDDLRTRILQKKGPVRPIAFSLDEIREIAKTTTKLEEEQKAVTIKVATKSAKLIAADKLAKPAQPNHIKAASLADILGFNPKKKQVPVDETDSIPEKFRRYYKLLIELRNHLTGQIDTHSEETLKRSSKDDAGDLSSYGQHMADAGTDTFDRDFALSLVSSEQEALAEVEAAIKRIKDGTYGICENSQKPIHKDRLVAVPFTRYTAEAQKDIEKNRMRSRTQAGLFGEMGEEGATLSPGSGGDDSEE
jgi:RNA polymerase-binding transcription factor DksA